MDYDEFEIFSKMNLNGAENVNTDGRTYRPCFAKLGFRLLYKFFRTLYICAESGVLWFASNNATRVILTLRAFRTPRRYQRLKRSIRSRLIDGSQPEHPRCRHRGCSGLPKFLLLAVILPFGSFERMRSQELKCSLARI